MAYFTQRISEHKKCIFYIIFQDQNDKISKEVKKNRLCVKYMLTIFDPIDTLPKLTVKRSYYVQDCCNVKLGHVLAGEVKIQKQF